MRLITLVFVLGSLLAVGQTGKYAGTNYEYSAVLGFNITNFKSDSLDFEYAYLPRVGVEIYKPINEKLGYQGSLAYALKGANVTSPYYKFRYHYADLNLGGRYEIGRNLRVQAGTQLRLVLYPSLITGSDDNSNIQVTDQVMQVGADLYAGLEFRVQKNVFLGFNYYQPVYQNNLNHFLVKLTIPVYQDMFTQGRKQRERLAYLEVRKMKSGVLLVKLPSGQRKIQVLEKNGRQEEADSVSLYYKQYNSEIINAFQEYFEFCPVLYFYDYNTPELDKPGFTEYLMDHRLEKTDVALTHEMPFYIAEFGYLDQRRENGNDVSVATDADIKALYLRDKQLNQLQPPFPFYVKTEDVFVNRSPAEAVKIFNLNLQKFYMEAMKEGDSKND